MPRNANILIHGLLAYRYLRVGEEMLATDKMGNCFGEVVPLQPGMAGFRVLGTRDGEDIVFRLCTRAPAGYSVRDFKTEFHAYHGGDCIAQTHSRDEAIGACYRHQNDAP